MPTIPNLTMTRSFQST